LTGVERWRTSLQQLSAALMGLIGLAGSKLGVLSTWLKERREASAKVQASSKRWVRPEPEASDPNVTTVESFAEIEQLIEQAGAQSPDAPPVVDSDQGPAADAAAAAAGEADAEPTADDDNRP
ncbi:MAG: hypothetical protein NTW83_13315, partial [Cyanobacteria bacterium]|nr:hypothetical protein [Cyanobacteriota bacterium]